MRKIYGTIVFKKRNSVTKLDLAFAHNFNPQSKLDIEDKEVKFEVVFEEKPPIEFLKALKNFEKLKLHYSENSSDVSDDGLPDSNQADTSSDTSDDGLSDGNQLDTSSDVSDDGLPDNNQTGTSSDVSENGIANGGKSEEASSNASDSQKKEAPISKGQQEKSGNSTNIAPSKFSELANKASSFDEFLDLVANWLEFGSKISFFKQLVSVSTELEKLSWEKIYESFSEKGWKYKQYDKVTFCNKLRNPSKNQYLKPLPFLNAIKDFKNYPFTKNEETGEEAKTSDAPEQHKGNDASRQIDCMKDIEALNKFLSNIDFKRSIQEKASYILEFMGVKKLSQQEQEWIDQITQATINSEKIESSYNLLEKTEIPDGKKKLALMTYSTFINDYYKENGGNQDTTLTTIQFLKDLKRCIS